MDVGIGIIGFLIGLLIGLTGMGGGSLMTPIMILILGVKPTSAVGTDLFYGAVTKIFGASVHSHQKTVNHPIALHLALGSVPMSLLGVALIEWLKIHYGVWVETFVTKAIGATLIFVAVSLFFKTFLFNKAKEWSPFIYPIFGVRQRIGVIATGALVGFLVGLTSVGSGTIIVSTLFFLFPNLSSRTIVGTDVFHGALLVTVAGLAHYHAGNIQFLLAANLLLGSIPGVLLGSKLSIHLPESLFRPVLASVLMVSGIKLI
jgi:uncharacterized protein